MGWRDLGRGGGEGEQEIQKPPVEQAGDLRRQGRLDEAWQVLEPAVRANPHDVGVTHLFWDLANQTERMQDAAKTYQRLIGEELKTDAELGIFHWFELVDRMPEEPQIDLDFRIALCRAMAGGENEDTAADLLARVHQDLPAETPLAARLELAKTAALCRAASAEELARPLLANAQIPEGHRQELAQLLAQAKSQGLREAPAQWDQAPIELSETMTQDRKLKVIPATPVAMDGDTITIEVANQGRRRMKQAAVQALATSRIDTGMEDPFVVVDLLVDSIWSNKDTIRTVRFKSNEFDARTLFPDAGDAQMALLELIGNLLAVSGAHPLPDPEAVYGRPFRSYGSLAEYARDVLDMAG
jgi:tetratricopeptide (TPR) repeat protein